VRGIVVRSSREMLASRAGEGRSTAGVEPAAAPIRCGEGTRPTSDYSREGPIRASTSSARTAGSKGFAISRSNPSASP
jgi:hypothetical protein